MKKIELPAFWASASRGLFSEAYIKIRLRVMTAAKVLAPHQKNLTDSGKARFVIWLYSAVSHVDAIEAGQRIADLNVPIKVSGTTDCHWPRLRESFEDFLTGVLRDLREGKSSPLLSLSICWPVPFVTVTFRSPDPAAQPEVYYFTRNARDRPRSTTYRENHIGVWDLLLLARLGAEGSENESAALAGAAPSNANVQDVSPPEHTTRESSLNTCHDTARVCAPSTGTEPPRPKEPFTWPHFGLAHSIVL